MNSKNEKSESLCYKKKTVYEKAGKEVVKAAFDYAVGYAKFLDEAKTERESVRAATELAKEHARRPDKERGPSLL